MHNRLSTLLFLTVALSGPLAFAQTVTIGDDRSASPEPVSDSPPPSEAPSPSPELPTAIVIAPSSAPPPAAPVVNSSRYEFDMDAYGRAVAIFTPPFSAYVFGPAFGGGADVTGTLFIHPLLNDDAPRSLQPFLQRASSMTLSLSGSGIQTQVSPSPGVLPSYGTVGATFSVDTYVAGFVALAGSLGLQPAWAQSAGFGGTPSSLTLAVPMSTSVGLRANDTRIDAGYALSPSVGTYSPSWNTGFQYAGFLAWRTVIHRFVRLSGSAGLIPAGARLNVAIGVYTSRLFGITAGLGYRRGLLATSDMTAQDRLDADIGFTRWLTETVGLNVTFTMLWTAGRTLDNQLAFSLMVRP